MPGASWADDAANVLYIPLIWPGIESPTNKVGQFVDTQGGSLTMQVQGSLTDLHYVYRFYRPLLPAVRDVKLGQMGIADTSQCVTERKTHRSIATR